MVEYNKTLEMQELKRTQDVQKREERIQSLMSKMADAVVKRNNDIEKEVEKRVMRYQTEKEEKDQHQEDKKKQLMKRKYEDIR